MLICDWYSLNYVNITSVHEDNSLFDRKIENATSRLQPSCKKILKRIPKANAIIIADYISSMQTEIYPSDRYKKAIIMLLCKFSQIYKDLLFEQMTRQDVIAFLDRHRKPETVDPLHKWIGTFCASLGGYIILRSNQTKDQNRQL